MDLTNIKMRNSWVLVKKDPVASVDSKLIELPDSAKIYDNTICTVMAVGPGEILENGEREPMHGLKPGDRVFTWGGAGLMIDERELTFCLDIMEIESKLKET